MTIDRLAQLRAKQQKRGRPYYYLRSGVLHEVLPRDYGVDLTPLEAEQIKQTLLASAGARDKQTILRDWWLGLTDGDASARCYNFDARLDRIAQGKRRRGD